MSLHCEQLSVRAKFCLFFCEKQFSALHFPNPRRVIFPNAPRRSRMVAIPPEHRGCKEECGCCIKRVDMGMQLRVESAKASLL